MSYPPLRLALLQENSPAGHIEAAISVIIPALVAAGAAGAQVLVVPESWLPGYNCDTIAALALDRFGGWTAPLLAACKATQCGLVIGYAERAEGGVYNAAMVIGADGTQIAHYRKIQLYGAREAAIYQPGDAYCIFEFHGQKTAVLICYDVEFASHVAALAKAGVTLLLVPTANMMPFTHVMTATVPAMAANHGVAIVYANYCGVEGDLTYAGGSLIAGPHGEILAQAGRGPALLITDLPDRDPARLSTQGQDLIRVALP